MRKVTLFTLLACSLNAFSAFASETKADPNAAAMRAIQLEMLQDSADWFAATDMAGSTTATDIGYSVHHGSKNAEAVIHARDAAGYAAAVALSSVARSVVGTDAESAARHRASSFASDYHLEYVGQAYKEAEKARLVDRTCAQAVAKKVWPLIVWIKEFMDRSVEKAVQGKIVDTNAEQLLAASEKYLVVGKEKLPLILPYLMLHDLQVAYGRLVGLRLKKIFALEVEGQEWQNKTALVWKQYEAFLKANQLPEASTLLEIKPRRDSQRYHVLAEALGKFSHDLVDRLYYYESDEWVYHDIFKNLAPVPVQAIEE